ncbi:hypothetical protein [Streptomyces sp. NPDC048603]|uniref:hypothetical protein n=1 Tax=Streptomyces sp. NPDC048603 TaxID=3365577 RepID=UPI003720D28E
MAQSFQPPAPDSLTPAAPAPARSGNFGLGIVAAVVAALATAAAYGGIIGASGYQIGYAAVGVGLAVGVAAGKLGGSNPVLPVVAALLSLAAVFGGQMFGIVLIAADELHIGVGDVLDLGFSVLFDGWKEAAGPMDFLFFAIGAVAAFQTTRKTGA